MRAKASRKNTGKLRADAPQNGGASIRPPKYGIALVDHPVSSTAVAAPAIASGFDDRPEAIAQRARQVMVDHSPQVQKAVQLQAMADGSAARSTRFMHHAARAGVQGSGGALPHLRKIQESFGSHDISRVQAFTDSRASAASRMIGAKAYATGNEIAFEGTPSLHTAAHEAAHAIQQRAGVQLYRGIGEAGDAYEQHADAVADAVVQGRSAEGLLDAVAPAMDGVAPGGASEGGAVQRKVSVASPLGDIDRNDFILLSHINYAREKGGDPVTDIHNDDNWANVAADETIYIVEHGGEGMIVGSTANDIATAINTLPQDFAGDIKVTSCYSGVKVDPNDQSSSLVGAIKDDLDQAHELISIEGVLGPSITNSRAHGDEYYVVDPAQVDKAGKIQNALLGRLLPNPGNDPDIARYNTDLQRRNYFGTYANMEAQWKKLVDMDPSKEVDLKILARSAAIRSSQFYNAFVALLQHDGLLLDNQNKKITL